MSIDSRIYLNSAIMLRMSLLTLAIAVGMGAWLGYKYISIPETHNLFVATDPDLSTPSYTDDITDKIDWIIFSDSGAGSEIVSSQSSLVSRFRLAGTYFVYDAVMNNMVRKAIIDDIDEGMQKVVSENDILDQNIIVARISRESVVLRKEDREEELRLSFSGKGGGDTDNVAGQTQEETGKQENMFGAQVRKNRWVMNKSALLDYYQDLRDHPERLVQVFDSFDPLYNESGKIEGYEIGIEGEQELFDSAGLREGDIVRKVNSLDMTSRRRAEYFIHEFVKGRANVFVMEIERKGTNTRQIYQVR